MAMSTKELSKKFKDKWHLKYLYYWDTYIDISHNMRMHCEEHGDFEMMPVSHYRREPCPQCKQIGYIREAIVNGWATIAEIAEHYGATIEQVENALGNRGNVE